MKEIIKKYYPLIIIILILALSHLNTVINNDGLMIFYGDSYEQTLHLYWGGWERFHQLDFSLWDWGLGYGANFFSQVAYFATTPFFYLTLLFEKAVLPYLFIYLNALKIFLLYIFTYRWLHKVYEDKFISTVGAIILSFSGWTIFYYHYNQFLDSFLFFPLILSTIEDYLKNKKWILYTVSLAYLGIISYYFVYMIIPFIVLYSIFRYFVINRQFVIKHLLITALKFLGYSILALGLASIILFPSINIVLQTPRLSSIADQSIFQTISTLDVFRYVSTLFTPVVERFDPTYFISHSYDPGIGWGGGVSVYSFMLFPVSIILLVKSEDKHHRNLILSFYAFLLFLASFRIFYRILQGSYDVRWYYMFTILNVYSIGFTLSEHFKRPKPKLLILISNFIVVLSIMTLYTISFNKGVYSDLNVLKAIIVLTIVLSTLYCGFLFFRVNKFLFLVLITIEAVISFTLPLYFDYPIESSSLISYFENTLDDEPIKYLQSVDHGFYRIISVGDAYTSQNEPIAQYYKGTSFYSSLYNFEQEDFLNRFKSNWSMPITFGRFNTNFLTSVKYYISNGDGKSIPFGFTHFKTINNSEIYVNMYYVPLGFSSTNVLNDNVFKKLTYIDQDRLLLDYIITDKSQNSDYQFRNKLTKIAEWVYNDYYYYDNFGDIKNKIIYVENFNIPVFSVNLNNNYEYVKTENFWQYNYFSIYFNDDSNIDTLEIQANNIYNSPSSFNIYMDENLDYYDEWYSSIEEKFFTNIEVTKDNIKATIELKERSWIATSIPYDKGWNVKINDKKIPFSKVNLGFIGFELEAGTYSVEFYYLPPLFKEGLVCSSISLALFLILVIKSKMNHQIKT